MNICVVDVLSNVLIPAILELRDTLKAKEVAYADVVKIGRTHLQDATPITLGQEISSWVTQIDNAIETVRRSLPGNPHTTLSQTLTNCCFIRDIPHTYHRVYCKKHGRIWNL